MNTLPQPDMRELDLPPPPPPGRNGSATVERGSHWDSEYQADVSNCGYYIHIAGKWQDINNYPIRSKYMGGGPKNDTDDYTSASNNPETKTGERKKRRRRPGERKEPATASRFGSFNTFVDVYMRKLQSSEREVWMVLWRSADKEGRVKWQNQKLIAEKLGLHQGTVSRAVRSLEDAGYLCVPKTGGKTSEDRNLGPSEYLLHCPPIQR